ncbi:MAG: alpha-glucan family phosphorylase [Chloroflexota bacterium]
MRPVATYTVAPTVPEALRRLPELAYNIRWAWDHETIGLFRRLDRMLWETSNHNPVKILGLVGQDHLNMLAQDDGFLAQLERVLQSHDQYMQATDRAWYDHEFAPEERPQIAYFSFEFGMTESIPNYSGGLGVLAGDHLKAASDLDIPLVGVGLLYQQGYFRQYLNIDGWQQELYPVNDFYTMPVQLVTDDGGEPLRISVDLAGKEVFAQIWHVQVGRIDLYLLDTNISYNQGPAEKALTAQLYGGDKEMRVRQEILLGIGGLRALHAVGIEPAVCHMNEGHAAFMALERVHILMQRCNLTFAEAAAITSSSNIFTTHTPVPAGNDYFAPELIEKYFEPLWKKLGLSKKDFMALGRFDSENASEHFCMTILALRMSAYANGVSQLHGDVARGMWVDVYPQVLQDEVPISAITNGVHAFSWVSQDMSQLYDRYLGPRWREDPTDKGVWQRAKEIPNEELWRTHERRRERLVAFARRRLVAQLTQRGSSPVEIEEAREALDPDVLTIGFARRFATYKRATLILQDPERLMNIVCGEGPVQFIFAGKAHPHDNEGKEFIRQIIHFVYGADCRNRIVFLEDYDMVIARYLVQGVDMWLNTPRRPMEASGTSGMKVALNGGLNLSILDGWWAEAYDPEVGWAIGAGEEYEDTDQQDYIESNALYDLLEKDIVPTFYDRGSDGLPRRWIAKMQAALSQLGPVFNMARTVQDYTRQMYYPALDMARRLAENDYDRGRRYANWYLNLRDNWAKVKVGAITPSFGSEVHVGDTLHLQAEVFVDDIPLDAMAVQLFEGVLNEHGEIDEGFSYDMRHVGTSERGPGWHLFEADFVNRATGRHGYTVRVIPSHPDVQNPMRLGMVAWAD